MQARVLKRSVTMPPQMMEENINDFLLLTLQKYRHDLNSKSTGYVTRINKILNYNNKISVVTGNIVFDVTFEADTIFLRKGLKMIVTVKMCLSTGILCQYQEIKIWIPRTKTSGYSFTNGRYQKDGETIEIGENVQVEISGIRYERKVFSCIARLTT